MSWAQAFDTVTKVRTYKKPKSYAVTLGGG